MSLNVITSISYIIYIYVCILFYVSIIMLQSMYTMYNPNMTIMTDYPQCSDNDSLSH